MLKNQQKRKNGFVLRFDFLHLMEIKILLFYVNVDPEKFELNQLFVQCLFFILYWLLEIKRLKKK
ncbi:hypothetical protein BpHYR1_014928 [Brachionus plicatilis]|uniref:Uncharacterized protein n=1 Tax=Brachionus plicatilis TaxID=10195 RepID=A0A3M7RF64_BRAPC|nr:hypothetical protein BpHYR1_014928 [Brachionus plicatilis]